MANALFLNFEKMRYGSGNHGTVDFDAPDDLRVIFVDHADDTPVVATDEDLADILAAARVAVTALTGEAVTAAPGFDSADVAALAVAGDQFESIVLYKHTGTESTSPLISFYDTATGLPCTPNGGDINVVVHANGWFND